ncbi:CDP-alcohol phosphatidyltransferase family protein [Salinigranum halophilum]|uniref:CDP-alcohol phosphatidyltransferase family protein n=1 Tax=Salinigranum halophilum TaxID=2565931 RepID=UPI00115DCBD8|nr:CDP-alcohol phosphatidyltransferase family protein [Salinigranum halophilum]
MSTVTRSGDSVPPALRRRWWLAVAFATTGTLATAAALVRAFDATAAGRWLLAAVPVAGYQLWFLRRFLGANRPGVSAPPTDPARASRDVSPTLGLANAVTVSRGWLYAAAAGFLLVVPPPQSLWRWGPLVLYGAGAALDAVDGYLARTVGQETELGAKLDMAFDTLGFLVAPLVGVVWGRLPVWYLSLSLARYLFKLGRGWRRRRDKPVYDLPESRVRRPLAGVQMAFITVALCPLVPVSVVWPVAAVVVTPSLLVFARDYLVVAGHLEARASG